MEDEKGAYLIFIDENGVKEKVYESELMEWTAKELEKKWATDKVRGE